MKDLLKHYHEVLKDRGFQEDTAQLGAVKALARITTELVASESKLRFLKRSQPKSIKGLYMWGGVGRGKTFLMDLFFSYLPTERKKRQHFNHFMQAVHAKLKELEGKKNPLELIAKSMANQLDIICFDEFLVVDIADAMLLGLLFKALFSEGIILVATSNAAPSDLYKEGLQRDRFLPAIKAIKTHCEVLNVDAGVDYRHSLATTSRRYHSPLKDQDAFMLAYWHKLVPDSQPAKSRLKVAGRVVHCLGREGKVIWFDFIALCGYQRGVADYIELAKVYSTLMLSNVPAMSDSMDDLTRRFIQLVDELYDNQCVLIVSAAVPIEQLYTGKRLQFEFERTKSRLVEMQAPGYGA